MLAAAPFYPMALDPSAPPSLPRPPLTRREDVVDTLHGRPVSDPYRWLEDGGAPEVRAWSAAQTARTESVLKDRPEYARGSRRCSALARSKRRTP